MKPLFTVKDSPGKGRGVFATKAIAPGTVIMNDTPAIKIFKDPPFINETDVENALRKLSQADQARFMVLHEGSRPYSSRAFRIYKANAFGDNDCGTIYLDVSLINHACVPNAECGPASDSLEVVAVKPIGKGEEVFITYNPYFLAMAKKHRNIFTRVYYGFECNCRGCTLPPQQQALSDSRRQILSVFKFNLEGYQAPDTRMWDMLGRMNAIQAEQIRGGIPLRPLKPKLSLQQETAYSFLMAKFLEAENITGRQVAEKYMEAAQGVVRQMEEVGIPNDELIITPMAKLALAWMRKGVEMVRKVNGSDSESYRSAVQSEQAMKGNTPVGVYLQCPPLLGDSFAFTFTVDDYGVARAKVYTEAECRKMIRGK